MTAIHDQSDTQPEIMKVEKREAPSPQMLLATIHASIGEAVMLLARDPKWRYASLADIEWLIAPAIFANQFMTLRGKVKNGDGEETGATIPIGLALWAKVSKEVDTKLKAQKESGAQFKLAPQDWTSGDIPWLVLISGPEAIQSKLKVKYQKEMGNS
ncbi:toxin-activating lysine-acyltransferase [Cohaesibacter haloalkalitolerans]|uniref:toxin-activating lysine-acyltransferase n=1 Tax=Cohaesibacter haloalkalitolerans TaxID=1162980 RepID=UPI000E6580BC|nr:toxin-activating lysine-acyltransferase [Cohaesibacter haloalkalitolerans]